MGPADIGLLGKQHTVTIKQVVNHGNFHCLT